VSGGLLSIHSGGGLNMSWTDERVELLKKLWTDGLSASQIASRMGGLTRNAVIGKVHRLGLSGRTRPARPRAPKPRHSVPSRTHRHPTAGKLALRQDKILDDEVGIEPEPQPTPINPIEIAPGEYVTILTLTETRCKWPIGDPTESDFHFCGHESGPESPYCKEHARAAYQPAQDRRKRKQAVGIG
jgi:GcrA cell cycle regulator